ncbi:hypothetical protein [Dyadobacter sp. 676]|uniref:Uncharacterized protein n=1 Tax=Dyadobacter sp. 676 TaxID=3088362 RepID=A0AAU8FG99_9BACT
MERIILEVNDELAKAWRNAPPQFCEKPEKDLEKQITKSIRQAEREKLFRLIEEVQKDARKKGLTQRNCDIKFKRLFDTLLNEQSYEKTIGFTAAYLHRLLCEGPKPFWQANR